MARNAAELEEIFKQVPRAKLCFDIGHARQHDITMKNALTIVDKYKSRIGQIHISEVGQDSRHLRISSQAIQDFKKLSSKIPVHVPVILETPVEREEMLHEIKVAENSLSPSHRIIGNNIPHSFLLSHFGITKRSRSNQLTKLLYALRVRC